MNSDFFWSWASGIWALNEFCFWMWIVVPSFITLCLFLKFYITHKKKNTFADIGNLWTNIGYCILIYTIIFAIFCGLMVFNNWFIDVPGESYSQRYAESLRNRAGDYENVDYEDDANSEYFVVNDDSNDNESEVISETVSDEELALGVVKEFNEDWKQDMFAYRATLWNIRYYWIFNSLGFIIIYIILFFICSILIGKPLKNHTFKVKVD